MSDSKNSNVTTRSMKVTIGEKKAKPQSPPKKKKDEEKELFKPYPPIKSKNGQNVPPRKPITPPPIGKRKGYRRPMKELLLIALLAIVVLAGMGAVGWSMTRKASSEEDVVAITIEAGMSATEVSLLLEEAGIVDDRKRFLEFVVSRQAASLLKSGTYILGKNSSYEEILSSLSSTGRKVELFVYPGYTLKQIDAMLTTRVGSAPGAFLKAAQDVGSAYGLSFTEGWFLGGTYSVEIGARSARDLALSMFFATGEAVQTLSDSPLLERYSIEELIIIASMIQAETQDRSQMGGIASVIHNRLAKNEPLGIDATTRYELDDWDNPIPVKALENKTPYNTRRKAGLPPSGISAPSAEALYAAFYPEETPYFYYLHGLDKAIHYAVDYEEHKQNIEKHRK
ncbi:MAG TPA: endolytic transglycosylase MltG [Sphaerochaeta sp.]|nr:endolytic transglycosylase MltG [Sphaerochaeta sp.]